MYNRSIFFIDIPDWRIIKDSFIWTRALLHSIMNLFDMMLYTKWERCWKNCTYPVQVGWHKTFRTIFTFNFSLPSVNLNMFIEVSLLSKWWIAGMIWTYKWSFSRMDPQVVEEIMPFSEEHIASLLIALQYLHESLRLRVFELENFEPSCHRHCLADSQTAHIVMRAVNYLNLCAFWNFFPNYFIFYRILVHHPSQTGAFVFMRRCRIMLILTRLLLRYLLIASIGFGVLLNYRFGTEVLWSQLLC